MLLEFSCSNFKSIKEKVTFSAIATDNIKNEKFLKKFDDFRILHTSVIYGPNGAGKSNIFKGIEFMRDLVIKSRENRPGEVLKQPTHKMAHDKKSEFNMQYIINDIRYAYGFVLKDNLVDEEYLYYFEDKNAMKVFEREEGEVCFGEKFEENKVLLEIIENEIGDNKLLLSCIGDKSDIFEINNAFLFFKEYLVIQNSDVKTERKNCIKVMMESEKMRELIISVFRELDSDIKDIKIESSGENLDDKDIRIKFVYDEFETDLYEEESMGINKLFDLVLPIVESFINGKVMIVDEIELNLHRNIAYKIISLFNTHLPKNSAQLIFTSHDISLLSLNLFRNDQIWFAQLGKDRATELYSLVEIKNIRADENIAKGYIMGRYGAVPSLKDNGGVG
ncbi:ATP-binding protein [Clostridium sp. 2218st1_F5_2218SCRN_220325]|uniref:AAA family ATPase n=1 Tax=Clostridium sp. 2218st1_F5_2218SCRN_220325 TaxID=3143056 RepID=UPI00319EB2B0